MCVCVGMCTTRTITSDARIFRYCLRRTWCPIHWSEGSIRFEDRTRSIPWTPVASDLSSEIMTGIFIQGNHAGSGENNDRYILLIGGVVWFFSWFWARGTVDRQTDWEAFDTMVCSTWWLGINHLDTKWLATTTCHTDQLKLSQIFYLSRQKMKFKAYVVVRNSAPLKKYVIKTVQWMHHQFFSWVFPLFWVFGIKPWPKKGMASLYIKSEGF